MVLHAPDRDLCPAAVTLLAACQPAAPTTQPTSRAL
jgi:hypothetical protein